MFVAGYYHFHCQIGYKRIGIGSVITGIFDRSDTDADTPKTPITDSDLSVHHYSKL